MLIAVWLAGCTALPAAADREMLNSERIEARFGNFGIRVLGSARSLRTSNLFSVDEGVETTRTFAVVEYPAIPDPSYEVVHAQILAGGSIGASFQDAGWAVTKTHEHFGTRLSTPALEELMHLSSPAALAAHIYRLDVERDGRTLPYARILEVHHPDYLSLDAVIRIYGSGPRAAREADPNGLLGRLADAGY